jgi:hypothetical protein
MHISKTELNAQQPPFGLPKVAVTLLLIGSFALLMSLWTPSAADASSHPCRSLKSKGLTKIVAQNLGCGEASLVATLWKRNCNYAGRCQVEQGGLPPEDRFVCTGSGRNSEGQLRMTCSNFQDRTEEVRFLAG